jgi:hypothetical protein
MLARFERFPTADAEMQTLFGGAVALRVVPRPLPRGWLLFLGGFHPLGRTPSGPRYHRGRRYVPPGLEIGKPMIDPELKVLHTGRRAHQVG